MISSFIVPLLFGLDTNLEDLAAVKILVCGGKDINLVVIYATKRYQTF